MNAHLFSRMNHKEKAMWLDKFVTENLHEHAHIILAMDSTSWWNNLFVKIADSTLTVDKLSQFCDQLKEMGFDVDVLFGRNPLNETALIIQFTICS